MKKKFDAVKMVREIRDKLHEETKHMTTQQRVAFYHKQAQEFYVQFNMKKSLAGNH